ncbi:LysR family transcriptional regulator [Kiloniella laminariae]|uniref:LysR family transcriptional regulator n=1 Tax=Kiloniella laminariae TaxID=454162 RepID=A0ABT4LED6_9PROT|nr:LysR family transcriptional regulator [Kiloniella laminariae]MCZ4279469.1 LysR family transcriptional regulator [Kiloniella laminariae]
MIDDLRAMAVFAKTVETGSFRAAAKLLGLSPSVVSHHVSQLEARLGVALLYRSTRRLSLTSEGEKMFEASREMMTAAESGLDAVAGSASEASGKLTITLPAGFIGGPLVDDLAAFALAFPRVELAISFTDHQQDLIREGIDLAVRAGTLQDSSLKSKKLFDLGRKLVGSREYCAGRSLPKQPSDLLGWNYIGLRMRPNNKLLIDSSGNHERIDYVPRIVVDDIHAVCQFTLAGLGLSSPPDYLVDQELSRGTLVEVLPAWRVENLPVYAIWPPNAPRTSLTFRCVAFLEERVKERGRSD